jgi:hypothetical protein
MPKTQFQDACTLASDGLISIKKKLSCNTDHDSNLSRGRERRQYVMSCVPHDPRRRMPKSSRILAGDYYNSHWLGSGRREDPQDREANPENFYEGAVNSEPTIGPGPTQGRTCFGCGPRVTFRENGENMQEPMMHTRGPPASLPPLHRET